MTEDENLEVTREGLLGLAAGKVKEAAGSLVGNDELARAGRLQQAQVDADAASDSEPADRQKADEQDARAENG